MSVVFTGKTALWLWRSQAVLEGPLTESDRENALSKLETCFEEVMESVWSVNGKLGQRWCGAGRPEVLGHVGARQGRRLVKVHRKKTPFDLYKIAGVTGVFVTDIGCSTFMCKEDLDIDTCALLYNELCGTYGVPIDVSRPFFTRNEPRTKPEQLETELLRAGASKIGMCLNAMQYVCPWSASPVESKLSVLFTLSMRRGGYSLPKPYLNQTIALTTNARIIYPHNTVKPDFVWPEQRLIVEYDSATFHTNVHENNRRKNEQDRARANALQTMGYTVYSLESNEVYDWNKFCSLTMALRSHLNVRWAGISDFNKKLAKEEHNKIMTLLDPLAGTFGYPQRLAR